jgi:acyl carrier protein
MNRQIFLEDLKTIINSITGIEKDLIIEESLLKDACELDSIDIVDLIMQLEYTYVIKIEDDQFEKYKTVKEIIDFLETLNL